MSDASTDQHGPRPEFVVQSIKSHKPDMPRRLQSIVHSNSAGSGPTTFGASGSREADSMVATPFQFSSLMKEVNNTAEEIFLTQKGQRSSVSARNVSRKHIRQRSNEQTESNKAKYNLIDAGSKSVLGRRMN